MNYKTIRYPGHCAQMRLLMNDLKLNHDRATLKHVLENAVPQTLQDVVIVYAAVSGLQDGKLREENYVNKIYPQVIAGRLWSAIQVTTAAGITAVVDLVFNSPAAVSRLRAPGEFPAHGRPRQSLRPLLRRRRHEGRLFGEWWSSGKAGHQRAAGGEGMRERSARRASEVSNP